MKKLICTILTTSFLFSCKHKEDKKIILNTVADQPVNSPKHDFTSAIQLNVGNYWVYSTTKITLHDSILLHYPDDSTFIQKDTVINNNKYSFRTNLFGLEEFLQKSGDRIINENNQVIFSGSNFSDTIYRDFDKNVGVMMNPEEEVTVPAGTFKTATFVVLSPGQPHYFLLNDPTKYNSKYTIWEKRWYAKNIGIVKSWLFYGNENVTIRELKNYKINQ